MQRCLQLALMLSVAAALPSAVAQQDEATAAAARFRCPKGYHYVPKSKAEDYNKVVGWTYEQNGLAGLSVFAKALNCGG